MPDRTLDVAALIIDLEPLPPTQVVTGEPEAGSRDVATLAGASIGVWTHTVGSSTDVEVDEVSVILSGAATVVINGSETVHLSAGTLLRLNKGDHTLWMVTQTLRKVYVIAS